jgi:xanthine/uracil/vitamin C permease (AzgA family)
MEGPDGVVDMPGSNDFSTIGDALAPSNLADALTLSLVPVIFALFMTDFFDTIGSAVAVGRSGGCSTTGASCRGRGSCCSSTRAPPRSAAPWAARA